MKPEIINNELDEECSGLSVACDQDECLSLKASVARAMERFFVDLDGEQPCGLYELVLAQVEEPLLQSVLTHTRGNQTKAARLLGINRNTLRKKLKLYGLSDGE